MTTASVVPLPPELGGTPREELAYRLRQQAIVSEFGLFALRCYDLNALFQRAAVLCARGMQTHLAKVLEFDPAENRFTVRAGVGWAAGVVGTATVGADLESPAGFAFKTGRPVISNHLTQETRFRTPKLLADHGVKRAINVLIAAGPAEVHYGVLEVDSSQEGRFEEADLAFMQGFASLLGVAVERQWTDARLRESEEQARLVIQGAEDYAFVTTDDEGRITSWCPGAETAFGYTAEEIVGQPSALLYTDEDREAGVPQEELRTARSATVADDDRLHVRKSGERFWVHGSTRPLHDAKGKLRGYLMIGRDETARRAEREALAVSEERTRMALLSADIGTWELDPRTGELLWDARCKALFGLKPEDAVSYETFLAALHADDRARVDAAVTAALDPDGTGEYDIEYRTVEEETGEARWVAARGKAFFENGSAVRFIGTVLDATDQKRREEQHQLLSREVSHRVKNSLAMVGSLLSLQMRTADDERLVQSLSDAHRRIMTVAELHDHLWQQRDANQVDLDVFLGDLCTQLQETAPHHRIVFQGLPVTLVADRAISVALVVNELVTNAAKYAYPHGRGGDISVALEAGGPGTIRIEVSDHGIGLPEGFDPKRSQDSLGMRLVASLTRQLGAQARFQRQQPTGTRVLIELPLKDRSAPAARHG